MLAYDESGMTASVSSSPPSAPQSLPPLRTSAGIEASTITSEGTCRFVMPLSEFVYDRRGPRSRSEAIAAAISAPPSTSPSPARIEPSPLFGLRPAASRASPCFANTSGKYAFTTWPKMIGSLTFIMVALRCTEYSRSSSAAVLSVSARNSSRAAAERNVASTISRGRTLRLSLSTVTSPSVPMWRTVSTSSCAATHDFSFERKSS